MTYNVSAINPAYDFEIVGASYIGAPIDGTAMFVTAKVGELIENLKGHRHCLVFAEDGMCVPSEYTHKNLIVYSSDAQREYAIFITRFADERFRIERSRKYTLTAEGYYIGEGVTIGSDAYIEPGVLIGHDVTIGDHAIIRANAVVKNAVIGDYVVINECAAIGASGFTMAEDEHGDKYRLPTLGKVIIGDHVEIGTLNNISAGSGGDTVIYDHVKLDALIHIAHDVILERNVELTAGAIVGGFSTIGEHGYMGLNSTMRNRRRLGADSLVGMGAAVLRDVASGTTVVGNPARVLEK